MSKDDDNAPEAEIETKRKKRVVRVVKRVVKQKGADRPQGVALDSSEEKMASAVGPADTVEDKVEKPKERTRRHSKKDKPVAGPDTLDSPSDVAPKVRRVKRVINVEPALSEWAKKHQSALFHAKLDQKSPFVASADMVSLSDEMVAIRELRAKADRSSDLVTPPEKDALANEAQIVQEKYEAAKDVHFRNISDKQKEADVAFQDVVAADEVLRDKMGLLNEATRKLENIASEIAEKQEAEQRLIEEIDAAQKELVRVREEVKQGIAGEVDSRKQSNVVDEEELVKIKARLDEAKKRTSDISKTLGERLQQKAASKEELSDLQAQPKEEQTTGFLSRAAAKVKELRTSAKTTATNLEVAARDKLIESSRADLDKALKEEERLTQEAELLSKKILINKQAIDEMERDPSGAAESSQRVQNQKAVLEGKFNELSRVSDSIGELSTKQTEQKDAAKVLESEVSVANQKVEGLQKVAEGKLVSLQESYRPQTPARDIGQKYQIQSPEAKKIEGALNTRIQRQIEAFEIEERIAKERERATARAEAERVAKERAEAEAKREAEQKILDAAAAKREKEYKEQRAKEEGERKAAEKIKEEERGKVAAAALKVRQEEAQQKERDRVSSLSSVVDGLQENRKKNRNLTMQLREAKEKAETLKSQIMTDPEYQQKHGIDRMKLSQYRDFLAAQQKVKDWESKLNDPNEKKEIIKILIMQAKLDLQLKSKDLAIDDPLIKAQGEVAALNDKLVKNDREFSELDKKASALVVVTDEEKQRIKSAKEAFKVEKPEVEHTEALQGQETNTVSPKSIDDAIKQAKACATEEEKAQVISAYVMQKIEDAKARYKEDNKDIVDVMKKVSDKSHDTKVSNKDSDDIRSDISQIVESVYGLDSDNAKKLSTEVFFGALKETGTVRTAKQWIEKKIMNFVQVVKDKLKSKDDVEQKHDWKDKASALRQQLTQHASKSKASNVTMAGVGHQKSIQTGQGQGI